MGSIYKRGQTYTAQFVVNGRRRQVALGTSSKRRALAALSKLEEAQQRGLWDPLSQPPAAILAPTTNGTVHSRPRSLEHQIEAFLRTGCR